MAKKQIVPEVERGQSVQFRVDEHIDVSGYQIANLLKDFIVARLQPEIKKLSEKHRHSFAASTESKDVTRKGVKISFCDNHPPYYTDAIEQVPIPPNLLPLLDAAEIIEKELHNDPSDDGWY